MPKGRPPANASPAGTAADVALLPVSPAGSARPVGAGAAGPADVALLPISLAVVQPSDVAPLSVLSPK